MNWLAALLIVAGAHFGPEILALRLGGSIAAWDYVMQGIAQCALWLAVGLASTGVAVRAAAAWGAFEAAQRPICRALLPMDHAPALQPGQMLCDAALGVQVGWLGYVVAFLVIGFAREEPATR